MITWRPYQTEIIESVFADWQAHDSLLAVAATGSGKTNVLWGIADRFLTERPGSRICVLAHRVELIEQPKARLEQFWPQRAYQAGIVMGDVDESYKQIIIATVQTLGHHNGKRLEGVLRYGAIDLLIIDEAHHYKNEGTYNNVISAFKKANPKLKHLGVTATPERVDKKSLNGTYEKESANVGVIRLIEEGWLCTPRVHGVKTNVDLSGVGVQGVGANRDYNQEQLVAAVETSDCFKLVVKTHLEKIGNRPTIAFVPSVVGAYRLAEMLRENGVAAVAADGTTPKAERAAILKDFQSGKHTVICNVALWTEGLDLPCLECCHLVRPTKSDSLYMQMVGRVLRTNPGKEFADIFDYQPKGDRKLDMRMKMLGIAKKPVVRLTGANGEGGEGEGKPPKPKAGNYVEYVLLDYFNRRKEAWVGNEAGWGIVALGRGSDEIERSLALPPDRKELWAIWRRQGEFRSTARRMFAGNVDAVSKMTDELIEKYSVSHLTNKNARWRKGQPSDKQISFGKRNGIPGEGLNAGQLSDAINQKLVMRAVQASKDFTTADMTRYDKQIELIRLGNQEWWKTGDLGLVEEMQP